MGVDNLPHQHLPPYIRVQSVDGEAGVHLLACGVVEVGFQVYEIFLLAYPAVDQIQFNRLRKQQGGLLRRIKEAMMYLSLTAKNPRGK